MERGRRIVEGEDKRILIMRDAPPLHAIITMSIPVILGMMVNVVYNLVDTYFIGLMGNELQLAASNLSTPIFVLIMAVASLISAGGASYLSRSLGAGQKDQAEKTIATAILLICLFGIFVAATGIIFRNKFLLFWASELSLNIRCNMQLL